MLSNRITFLFLLLSLCVFGQQKITVETVFNGEFSAKGMDKLQSMQNTNQYTVLNYDRTSRSMQIDLFDFATLKKVATLIDTKNQSKLTGGIMRYSFSSDEKMILIANKTTPIYRHSFTADYFLYNIETKELNKVLEQVQEPTFSPDGKKIAYAKGNNLFIYDIAFKSNTQITTDGKKNAIINGITDWVYEEEFAFVRAFDWSKDSKKIAFIRFDESQVPEFSMSVFAKDLMGWPRHYPFRSPCQCHVRWGGLSPCRMRPGPPAVSSSGHCRGSRLLTRQPSATQSC